MDVLYVVIDTLAITLALLITGSLALSTPRPTIVCLVALIFAGYACYVLSARQDYAFHLPLALQIDFGSAYTVVNLARNSLSIALMLLAHVLFREQQRFPRILIALIVAQLFLEEPLGWILGSDWAAANGLWSFVLYEFAPACLQTLFTIVALFWVIREHRFDLVESRRAIRVLALVLVGTQGLMSLLVERIAFTSGLVAFQLMYPVHMVLIALQVLIFGAIVFWMLRRDLLQFLEDRPNAEVSVTGEVDTTSRDVERILGALEADRVYRQMGLTVADLARHVGIPEYRLRNLIHNKLGYRNFNSLLHHYRVEEVVRSLEDPKQNQTPILTLALSAGYQSINPFNRAFKERKQLTPSEYRARAQR